MNKTLNLSIFFFHRISSLNMGDTLPWASLNIDVATQIKQTTNYLLAAPMLALEDWPYWIGFAGLEYVSDYLQTMVMTSTSAEWRRPALAVIRGGILSTNLQYWDQGH